jgi:hypothetical protein
MLYRPLLVIRWHPSVVCSLLNARSLLSFFGTFGWLLGVLGALLAHVASFFTLTNSGPAYHRSHDASLVLKGKREGPSPRYGPGCRISGLKL